MPTPVRRQLPAWIAAVAVLLLSVNLRPGATSVGPVLTEVKQALAMSPTIAGVLTALPGAAFAMFGSVALLLGRRLSTTGAITVGAVAAAAGLLLRVVTDSVWIFLAFTVLAFAGMAVGNVLVPAFVKQHFPRRTAALMAVYGAGLSLGATVPAAVVAPIAAGAPGGWRSALGVWGVTAAIAVLPWIVLLVRERVGRKNGKGRGQRPPGVARSGKAVALGLFFGTQSMQAYVQFGWVAEIYRDGGLTPEQAGLMASILAGCGVPGGLLMPWLVSRLEDLRPVIWALGLLLAAGYLGLWLAPGTVPWLWALLLGLSGFAFPTALALITARTRSHRVTTALSAFSQTLGYTLAAVGPFLIGALFELSGGWTVPLLLLVASSAAMIVFGLRAASPGAVDDELPAAPPPS